MLKLRTIRIPATRVTPHCLSRPREVNSEFTRMTVRDASLTPSVTGH